MYLKHELFIIVEPTQTDILHLVALYNNASVMQFIPQKKILWNIKLVEEKINKFKNPPKGIYIIKSLDHKFIGEASVFQHHEPDTLEIGFILHADFWNKGLGTLVCSALIDYCLHDLGTHRVIARMYKDNIGSQKVCRKAGMTLVKETTQDFTLNRLTYIIYKK